jgi:hypothetical protein
MPYTAEHPPTPSSDELRARIPGWGADLDPADRPSVPRLKLDPEPRVHIGTFRSGSRRSGRANSRSSTSS